MSRKPENTFIASVHRHLPVDLYHMKTHNAFISGPADVWYSGHVGDLWVEYKYVEKLPMVIDLMDKKKKYSLTALQADWLRDRFQEGRKIFVILGCKQGGVIFTLLNWENKHRLLDCDVMDRKELAKWISTNTKGSYEAPAQSRNRRERCL